MINCEICGTDTSDEKSKCVTHPDWVAHGETMPRWICNTCYTKGDYGDFQDLIQTRISNAELLRRMNESP